ncbi:hypothetical protein Kpol_479p28 [Vanderwaltozyma polyspora DSM 70294]|uniref:Inositol polyphosphate-related phosphatase domain-containing protein n=1 Tax=Vanderwaltozyma polyspora (strain ATCC 22028 / DSM 70294 / BCRC 21397 / CBS 2163 / NBRC 10782 / NRRL Y-8283 / UCD 57-17) TaxID=436907 RepID=A7TQE1_VANPO|nr:uncharacterized protein Kpol_479p28 [Vanderwaltozyma polyspora DSM 70294]EDO15540.1 hypothetical protein Kpol_479p28 [Vanderwaltozyma polyspora DSM 70294]
MDSNWKIQITSFNCGKAFPHKERDSIEDISYKLIGDGIAQDMYIFGFQEFTKIWEGSFGRIVNSYLQVFALITLNLLHDKYPDKRYNISGLGSLGAIGIIIIVDDIIRVNRTKYAYCKKGILGSSLKGAVSTTITCSKNDREEETFSFICSHFNANEGETNMKCRIDDYNCILTEIDSQLRLTNFRNGHIFFFGDLNFRLNKFINGNEIEFNNDLIRQKLLENHDELNLLRKDSKIFQEFEEVPIKFPPTYKFLIPQAKEPFQENYYNLKRTSSWCDRILFLKYENPQITIQTDYKSIKRTKELVFTDHQPVTLMVNLPIGTTTNKLKILSTYEATFTKSVPLIGNVTDFIIGYTGWYINLEWYYLLLSLVILFIIIKLL